MYTNNNEIFKKSSEVKIFGMGHEGFRVKFIASGNIEGRVDRKYICAGLVVEGGVFGYHLAELLKVVDEENFGLLFDTFDEYFKKSIELYALPHKLYEGIGAN